LRRGITRNSSQQEKTESNHLYIVGYSRELKGISFEVAEEGKKLLHHIPAAMAEARAVAMIESLAQLLGSEYPLPIYAEKLQPPRPFLVPSLDDEPVEILPTQKASQKIIWEESILVKTINNRFTDDYPDDDEEGSYEIEIVGEGEDDDADFYVEIVDGEVFYVFETEDDISSESSSEESGSDSDSESETGPVVAPAQFSIPGMELPEVPHLDETPSVVSSDTFFVSKMPASVDTAPVRNSYDMFNASALTMGESFDFLSDDDDLEDVEAAPALLHETDSDKIVTKPTRRVSLTDPDKIPKTPMRCDSPWDKQGDMDSQSGEETIDVLHFEESNDDMQHFEESMDGEEKKSVGDEESLSPAVKSSAFESNENLNENMYSPPKMPRRGTSIIADDVKVMKGPPITTPPPSPPTVDAPAEPVSVGSEASPTPSTKAKSILKVCPDSPQRVPKVPDSPKKKKKEKGAKEKKTFTKTYVRAEDFDGESRVYTWEKPTWTNSKLKSTGQGEMMRDRGNLASPITHIEKNINAGADEDAGVEKVDKEELIRRIKGASGMRGHRKLKFSIHGAKIREGGDIVQPITKATVFRKRDDVNLEANPAMLKATAVGQKARETGNLAGPITQATVRSKPEDANRDVNRIANKEVLRTRSPVRSKSYEWEKPEWSSGRLRPLRSTRRSEEVKEGGDVAQPITDIPKKSSDVNEIANPDVVLRKMRSPVVKQQSGDMNVYGKKTTEWEKPAWTKMKLGSTRKGEVIKSGQNLEKPITFPNGKGPVVDEAVSVAEAASPDLERGVSSVSRSSSSEL
jgi:hypothetical protein